ncbi:cache domain-containing sensor histidine kinase [Paenibacillus harenae]|uniref:cache domain-containing sensor histidine kinase n=1 Tax=Paenibacillus harenae TaxID=306543 RepID=UPI00279037C9|nr:sensor histidine kinase [Paenibacillus harenae]MDQ0063268.1 two-component system sensor histidine kinase YesM [Paenibacillus harenae]
MFRERRPLFPLFPLKSIQSSIAFAFSVLILLTIAATSLFAYRLSVNAVERNSKGYIQEVINQVNTNIQSYVDNMENISLLAMTNKDVKYYISSNSFIGNEGRRPYEKRISDLFQSILYTRKDIASIMVFGYNGRFVSDRRITTLNPNAKVEEQAWYVNAQREGGKSVISEPHVQNIIQNEYRWVVSLSRELKNSDGMTADGIFLVDLNLSVINDLLSQINLGKKGYVFIVDGSGNIVYHPEQQLIYSNLRSEQIAEVVRAGSGTTFKVEDEEGKRFYSVKDTSFGWKIVGVAYAEDLIGYKSTLINFLFITLGGVAVSLVISVLLSRRLSRPIRNLQRNMRKVEKGNFDVQAEVTQMNEIGQLARTFNMMVGQIKNLMQEIFDTHENKRKSELQLLQAQINPHFLYNTLDSIVWMAETKKHEEVVEMTSALAKLFRAGITKEQELVPIRIELEHITNYLLIQKMRYSSKLDYRLEISDSILGCKTLKILLQPFVENAIYHGIRNMPGSGTIVIRGMETQDGIVFEVEDDGLGMTEEQLEKIWEAPDGEWKNGGIGIRNVNERIRLYFGQAYGISIRSELAEGTCVTIRIPKIEGSGGMG